MITSTGFLTVGVGVTVVDVGATVVVVEDGACCLNRFAEGTEEDEDASPSMRFIVRG